MRLVKQFVLHGTVLSLCHRHPRNTIAVARCTYQTLVRIGKPGNENSVLRKFQLLHAIYGTVTSFVLVLQHASLVCSDPSWRDLLSILPFPSIKCSQDGEDLYPIQQEQPPSLSICFLSNKGRHDDDIVVVPD